MARDEITITLGDLDGSKSLNVAEIAKQAVTQANGITLKDAAGAKYESIWVVVENTANADKNVIVKAGNGYTNKLLGDDKFTVEATSVTCFQFANYARFLNKGGSIDIDFATGFTGNIYAIGQRAGIKTSEQ